MHGASRELRLLHAASFSEMVVLQGPLWRVAWPQNPWQPATCQGPLHGLAFDEPVNPFEVAPVDLELPGAPTVWRERDVAGRAERFGARGAVAGGPNSHTTMPVARFNSFPGRLAAR